MLPSAGKWSKFDSCLRTHQGSYIEGPNYKEFFAVEYNLELLIFLGFFIIYNYKPYYVKWCPVILVLSGLVTSLFPQWLNPYYTVPGDLYAVGCMGARATVFALILCSIQVRGWMLSTIANLTILSCVLMLINKFRVGAPWGLNFNSSMDGTLIAIAYPVVLYWVSRVSKIWIRIFYILFPIIMVFVSKSSVGIGGICLGLAIIYMRARWKFIIIPIILFLIALYINPALLDENGRVKCWVWSMNWWWGNANHWFGTGLGTYGLIGPYIQIVTGNNMINGTLMENYYYEMHNDWLQLVFELGYIGLAAGLLLLRDLMRKSWDRPHFFASVVVFAAVSGMNYPSHCTVTALFAIILIKAIDNN